MSARRTLGRLCGKAGNACHRIARWMLDPAEASMARRVRPWFVDQGDKTLRLQYDLREDSIVVDVGGFEGQWASDIYSMYRCRMHVFEPVPQFAERIAMRFARNDRIQVHRLGLAGRSRTERMLLSGDGSSVFREGSRTEQVELVHARRFLEAQGLSFIDLMKINIEGGEYELLEHLLTEGMVARIQNLQIQFHDIFPDAETRMRAIQSELGKTHTLTYQYLFVWENWRLNAS